MELALDFKRTILRVNIYGEVVDLTQPTYGEMKKFEREINKKNADEEAVFKFLVKRGMKKSLIETMEMEHLFKVIELFKQKKS